MFDAHAKDRWSQKTEQIPSEAGRCDDLARGFCAASVDGYCIGGRSDGTCYG